MTEFRPVPSYPTYHVSDTGIIRNTRTGRILTPLARRGRTYAALRDDEGRQKFRLWGEVVAEAWLDRPADGAAIRWKDGDPHNNVVSNLEWVAHPPKQPSRKRQHDDPLLLDYEITTICVRTGEVVEVRRSTGR